MHGHQELLPLAIIGLVALLLGLAASRLRQPPVVGYIMAGVVLGPSGFGAVGNAQGVALLAEIGVLLLLFVIGMELSLRSFRRIWRIAAATAALQILGVYGVMYVIGGIMGWPGDVVLLLAFAVALSSTAVAIKMLEQIGELRTHAGRIAVGVLIAQDLAVVPMMLTLEIAVQDHFNVAGVARIALSVGLLILLILFLSQRRRVSLPVPNLIRDNPDLRPVLALSICLGAATLSGLLGLSPAYGAFLAGLTLGNSNLRPGLVESTLPIQSLLMMVFFLSVGLLIDLALIWEKLGLVLALLLMVTVLKTGLNIAIFRVLGLEWRQTIIAGVVLAQVGEFSFLLAGMAVRLDLVQSEDFRLVITVTALSLAISPFWLATARRVGRLAHRTVQARELPALVYGPEARWLAARIRQGARHTGRLATRMRHMAGQAGRLVPKRARRSDGT